jgi:sec-independent protein translocase protein TatB
MFDLGMAEMLIVTVVAFLVVKPEELPELLRSFGKMMGKVRNMSKEFKNALDDAVNETGVKDITTIIGDDGTEYETYAVTDIHERGQGRKKDAPGVDVKDDAAEVKTDGQ